MTPIRRQYLKIKGEHPDAILLFRMGDFYETFDDDAVLAAKELEITLTSRSMGKGRGAAVWSSSRESGFRLAHRSGPR